MESSVDFSIILRLENALASCHTRNKIRQNSGVAITRLKVLVNEQWKDAAGNDQKHVESYVVVSFNGLAEDCGNSLSTGSKVFVRGRHRTRNYEKDGVKRYVT